MPIKRISERFFMGAHAAHNQFGILVVGELSLLTFGATKRSKTVEGTKIVLRVFIVLYALLDELFCG